MRWKSKEAWVGREEERRVDREQVRYGVEIDWTLLRFE